MSSGKTKRVPEKEAEIIDSSAMKTAHCTWQSKLNLLQGAFLRNLNLKSFWLLTG